jgi:hypothetical protein
MADPSPDPREVEAVKLHGDARRQAMLLDSRRGLDWPGERSILGQTKRASRLRGVLSPSAAESPAHLRALDRARGKG